MYTQQSQQLANIVSQFGNGQQAMAMMQTLANCAQPLVTRGPVSINGAASSRPPRAGYMTSYPNNGNGQWNQYNGNGWNSQDPSSPPTNDGNYWGGDTFMGDTYLQSIFNQNLSEWYQQQFTDNSYNDFRTMLNTTENEYLQTVNNFGGDNYFDNTTTYDTTTNNNVINEGDVTNLSTVVNQGDVYNNNNTYLNENKTFINNDGNTVNLATFVSNVVVNIINGQGPPGAPKPPAIPRIGDLESEEFTVYKYSFDPETCALTETATKTRVGIKKKGG